MISDEEQAQAYIERDLATNLALALKQPTLAPGLPECEECGEAIHPKRQDDGARLCVRCQSVAELHARVRAGARS
jgi:RNA polymerase-binding transcription factor DksA